ncbi:hypothetical protein ACJMK2_017767 [Sinanodonta woodiana]|uniref:Cilia- and flagella-associated protein 97 n=1 Tax=Sinanodonta woodiana TaxID=1069815 RepID=A0ABD3UF71_SINWO
MTSSVDTRPDNATLPNFTEPLRVKRDQTYYNKHKEKLREVKPIVDTKAPATYMHLHLRLKKLQLEKERQTAIERDNKILLDKMSYVKRTRSGKNISNTNTKFKSLNREKRQRYLSRVTEENLAMLYRITDCQPEYSNKKWQQEWEIKQRYMKSICHFPKVEKRKSAKNKEGEKKTEDGDMEKDKGKGIVEESDGDENTKINRINSKKEKDATSMGGENRNV